MEQTMTLEKTDFKNFGTRVQGKVRDVYIQEDTITLVATDRYSAFDRNLALIPHKGAVLTAISNFWFEKTRNIIQNHLIGWPDPNAIVVKKCSVLPIEVVVRGYITGVTSTALWTLYTSGERNFGGVTLPDGLQKNAQLPHALLTPTTKSDTHDRPITREEIISEGHVPESLWSEVERVALELFARGQLIAKDRGLILVDTKYEFGVTPEGELMLIDEIHTPDSSRYWQLHSYQERITAGLEPENFDKEFLRLWFKANCDPYGDAPLPEAPAEMITELSRRYMHIYEQLLGEQFVPHATGDISARIESNLTNYFTA